VEDRRPTQFAIGGILTVEHADDDPATRALVARELDPFVGTHRAASADLVLERARWQRRPELIDIHGLAADGVLSASDGRQVYGLLDGRLATIPDPWRDPSPSIVYEPGFPLRRLFPSLLRPSMQVLLARREVASIHAASVDIEGSAILVAGWSESGKTETALALMEGGAGFLSDKWTLLSADGRAAAFPINVGVRRWVLEYLPTLRGALPRGSSMQFLASAAARRVLSPITRAPLRGRVGGLMRDAAGQAVALADRVGLTPSELRAAYDQRDDAARRIPMRMLVLLTTVPDGRKSAIRDVSLDWAIERLVRAAVFERRPFSAWLDRVAYAAPDRSTEAAAWPDLDRDVLQRVLGSAQLVHIDAPFPTDPRRVADLIRDRLR
jgi:hypothetical protein